MVKEYLDIVMGTKKGESSPFQVFWSQNCVWAVQACLRKYCTNLLKLQKSFRAERAAGNSFVLASALCICIGHSFHLGSCKCTMKISSVDREFIHAGCPIKLWSGRQWYMHNPSAASGISGVISISMMHCCAYSLLSVSSKERFSEQIAGISQKESIAVVKWLSEKMRP